MHIVNRERRQLLLSGHNAQNARRWSVSAMEMSQQLTPRRAISVQFLERQRVVQRTSFDPMDRDPNDPHHLYV
jgi:hypothetical protein